MNLKQENFFFVTSLKSSNLFITFWENAQPRDVFNNLVV